LATSLQWLAELAGKVYSVEIIDELGQRAIQRLKRQRYSNVEVRSALATLCDQQAGEGFANPPVQRIEQVVRPNTQQQNALADLKKASEDAASDLQASCPTQMPQTPVARLDAVATRLKGKRCSVPIWQRAI
jgi:hypothetical protein